MKKINITLLAVICISACTVNNRASKQPSPLTQTAKNTALTHLNFSDRRDFERAEKGFIATLQNTKITDSSGKVVYDFGAYDFLQDNRSATVNASLWRQSELVAKHGLFKVTDGIYQVRGFDLSNITFIEGKSGWIVVDPLISKETAAAALSLVERELGKRKISAVLFTHSHVDHFGGVKGLVTADDIATGTEIVAPIGFTRETVSENILAGNTMTRRASYMFGSLLPKSANGNVGVGLGQGISSGNPGLLRPTIEITENISSIVIDGVTFEMILALGAEAPTEFMFFLPEFKAFCQAEEINHTLHNLYTPRGAQVRDGRKWSEYIDQVITRFGPRTEVSFGSHHWPVWGNDNVIDFWSGQRDLYRYIHDQTLRLANHGYTMHEIPSRLKLPAGIASSFANRGYYGTVSHNSKAQYQLYFGYFDGNPAHLDPLEPVVAAQKYVEYMGGSKAILARAKKDFARGEYQFVATALNHLVFAQPQNNTASTLLADTYEQLGYRAESGAWRNFYLTGAKELRDGIKDLPTPRTNGPDFIKAIPLDLYFDFLAVRLNGPKAADKQWRFNFEITDKAEKSLLIVSNGTLHHRANSFDENANASIYMTRDTLDQLNMQTKTLAELVQDGSIEINGDIKALQSFFSMLDNFEFWFEIVKP